jgi:cell division protein FtsA
MELASRVRLEDDRMALEMVPMDFTVDGRAGYRNPKGATCRRLEANLHVITCSLQEHQALVSAVHQAHLAVEESVFEPVAAAYAAVLPDDRARGVALIDIGAHSTNVVVYDGDALLLAAGLPVCGDHFTRDVAVGLKVTYEDAEHLKCEYGCAILGLTADNSYIELPSYDARRHRHGAAVDGGRDPDRRRGYAGGHVRHGRDRFELPGAQWPGGGRRGLARGSGHARLDHAGRAGDVLGAAEIVP